MGTDVLTATFKGKASKVLIERTIAKRAARDAEVNGHQDGYSGDWQCVDSIDINYTIFSSESEAKKFLNDNTEKWGPALVVYYLTKDPSQPTIKTIVQAVVPC